MFGWAVIRGLNLRYLGVWRILFIIAGDSEAAQVSREDEERKRFI